MTTTDPACSRLVEALQEIQQACAAARGDGNHRLLVQIRGLATEALAEAERQRDEPEPALGEDALTLAIRQWRSDSDYDTGTPEEMERRAYLLFNDVLAAVRRRREPEQEE